MNNLIEFMRMFLSYIVCFATFVAVAIVGIFLGIKWRKCKDAKEATTLEQSSQDANTDDIQQA